MEQIQVLIQSQLQEVLSPQCYSSIVIHHQLPVECFKFILSKLLGCAIIAGSFILKLPQILKIVQAQDVTGLTATSFYMEVLIFSSNSAYNYLLQYPFSTWGENVVILIQNIVLVLLLWRYSVPAIPVTHCLGLTILFIALVGAMLSTPPAYQFVLISAGIPMSILAKLPQIGANFQQKHTGQLAIITLALNFIGSAARFFTTMQETGDVIQLGGFALSVALNGMLVLQVLMYWSNTSKVLQQAKDKKKH